MAEPATTQANQGCPNCDSKAPLVSEFERTGVVQKCAICGFIPRGLRVVPTGAASATVPATVAALTIPTEGGATLVDLVRSRLAALDLELAKLDKMKLERVQLRRMLRAAESKR